MGQRTAMVGAALAIFVGIFTANAPVPLYSYYQVQWGFSTAALTAVYAVFAFGVLAALIIIAPLADRLGRRRLLLPGVALIALSAVMFLYATDIGWLMAARLVNGVGTGTVTASAAAVLIEADPAGNRRRGALIATLMFAVAASSGPAVASAGLYFDFWPAVMPFSLTLIVSAIAGGSLFLAPETAPHAGRPVYLRDWRPQRPRVPAVMLLPFLTGALALTLAWMTGGLFASLVPSFARELLSISNLGLAGLFSAVFQGLGGFSQLWFQSRSVQRCLTLGAPVLVIGLCVCLLSFHLVSPLFFGIGTVVAALGFGGAFAGSIAVVGLSAPEGTRAEVFSALYIIGYMAVSLPVLVLGLAADLVGFKSAILVYVAVIGSGMVLILLLVRWGHATARVDGDADFARLKNEEECP